MIPVTKPINLLDDLYRRIEKAKRSAAERAQKSLIAQFKRKYSDRPLYSVFYESDGEHFFRTCVDTYDQVLGHLRIREVPHYIDKGSQTDALAKISDKALQQPTLDQPVTLTLGKGSRRESIYWIWLTTPDQLLERLQWKFNEDKRSEELRDRYGTINAD